jgi:lipopolysaccharide assembly outer membrane protein LptD (OstA)
MALFRLFPRALLILLIVLAAIETGSTRAAERSDAQALPPGVKLSAEHIGADEKNGAIVASGAVTIEAGFGRIQADKITFREGHLVEAEGNVLLVWGNNRISGTRMTYDMGIKDDPDPEKRIARGVIENAVGQVDPEFYFDARQVDTIGDDRVVLHHATVTTCTQPVPYWSFHVSTAKIQLEGYAHMFNLRPAIKKVPFFYLPYLIWPVKRERAPGLLFPEFGATTSRGYFMSIPVFFPLGPSADLTLFPEYYTIGGWAAGAKLRLIPNRDGYAEAQVQYVWDQVTDADRYRVQLKQTQDFINGFRMVSDVDIVSDFNYFTDFVRNLTYASSPTILGRVTFTRSGAWTSVLVQEQYREQLFSNSDSTLVQNALPEIEWRGRSRRIGKSPLYFTFTSSVASLHQNSDRLKADYYRGDLAPTITAPWSPRPWIDITPQLAVRSTYWTSHQVPPVVLVDPQAPVTVIDQALWRNLLAAGVDFRGPKFVKIFETKPKPAKEGKDAVPALKYKNTIEPSVAYTYQQAFDKNDEIIVYDEVDTFGFNANSITYGLASRLIAQRPRAAPEREGATGEKILVPEGESGKLREAPSATPEAEDAEPVPEPGEEVKAPPLEPIEIASIQVAQSYSFGSNPSSADLDGNPATAPETSHFSGIAMTGRYNPSRYLGFSVTGRYDALFREVSDLSLSGNFRQKWAQGLFSVVYRPGLGFNQVCNDPDPDPDPSTCSTTYSYTAKPDATQVRFQGNFGPIAGRLRLGIDATYNLSPSPDEVHLPYRRWRVEYYTQCCGFLAEYLASQYTAFPRREFRFAVDLRGIGKLFDFNQANQ